MPYAYSTYSAFDLPMQHGMYMFIYSLVKSSPFDSWSTRSKSQIS